MKRLFVVKNKHSNYQSVDFNNKMLAKAHRDKMGDGCYIAKGPDHIGKHGNHNPKRMNK